MSVVYFGLGTNLGNREENLRAALHELAVDFTIVQVSPVYETDPVGFVEQPAFLNLAVSAMTTLSPNEALERVKRIEQQLGRMKTVRNGPRVIDIDILLYDNVAMNTDALSIPHPRLHERAFVLVPLLDIAPDIKHPGLNKSINELHGDLVDTSGVRRTSVAV